MRKNVQKKREEIEDRYMDMEFDIKNKENYFLNQIKEEKKEEKEKHYGVKSFQERLLLILIECFDLMFWITCVG